MLIWRASEICGVHVASPLRGPGSVCGFCQSGWHVGFHVSPPDPAPAPPLRRDLSSGGCGLQRARRAARGGKTELENEVGVCRTCHALIHAGLLRVSGDANGELQWLSVGAEGSLGRDLASDGAVADRLPVLQLVAESANSAAPPGAREESAPADSGAEAGSGDRWGVTGRGLDLEALAHGLMRLGLPIVRSRQIIGAAIEALRRGEIAEAGVLRRALALI